MKVSKNKVILVVLIVVMLAGTITYKIISNKDDSNKKTQKKCDEKNFFLGSYSHELNEEEDNYYFLKSSKDYEKIKDIIRFEDEEKLDFDNKDYLVFLLPNQYGCSRTYHLQCFEQRDKEVYLNFEKYEVDDSCDAIFMDSIIIELEKDKYNDKTEIKSNL